MTRLDSDQLGMDYRVGISLGSLKICRGDFIHLVKKGRVDFILVAKNLRGIISTYTKMTRGDSIRGGFCPTLRFDCNLQSGRLKCYRFDITTKNKT